MLSVYATTTIFMKEAWVSLQVNRKKIREMPSDDFYFVCDIKRGRWKLRKTGEDRGGCCRWSYREVTREMGRAARRHQVSGFEWILAP